jgi:tetratricopeptide (TPR) repeat protein
VEGEIICEGAHDLSGLSVQLVNFNALGVYRKTSVEWNGQFVFWDVPLGSYMLQVLDVSGKKLVSQQLFVAQAMAPVRVRLSHLGAPRPPEGAVSATRLMHRPVKKAIREAEKADKLARGGAHSEAAKHLEEAVRLDPEYFAAHNNLGVQYARLGRFPDAVAAFERAIALDPSAVDTQKNMAFALLKVGRVEEAQSRARIAAALAKRHTAPQ